MQINPSTKYIAVETVHLHGPEIGGIASTWLSVSRSNPRTADCCETTTKEVYELQVFPSSFNCQNSFLNEFIKTFKVFGTKTSSCDIKVALLRIKKNSIKIKSSLYSPYYAEACNEWWGPSPRLSACSVQHSYEETSQRWRAVGDTTSYWTFKSKKMGKLNCEVTSRVFTCLVNMIVLPYSRSHNCKWSYLLRWGSKIVHIQQDSYSRHCSGRQDDGRFLKTEHQRHQSAKPQGLCLWRRKPMKLKSKPFFFYKTLKVIASYSINLSRFSCYNFLIKSLFSSGFS